MLVQRWKEDRITKKKGGGHEQRESGINWGRKDWGSEELSCQSSSKADKKMREVCEMKNGGLEEH